MSDFIPMAARKVAQIGPFVSAEPHDWDFSPGSGVLRLSRHRTSVGYWWGGDFVDYRGIVTIQREAKFTRLDAVANGRCYTRTYRAYYGDRTVSQLCRQFLSELHGAPNKPSRRVT